MINLKPVKTTTSVLALVLSAVACQTSGGSNNDAHPNVVFFLVDDMGWTDVACYGSNFYQTPNIDALAKSGMLFTDAYSSCTVCSPTRAAIMTGNNPAKLRITDWIEGHDYPNAKLQVPDWTMYLDTSKYTMVKAFRDAGYATCHIGKWHLGESSEYWPENHGFDINIGGWAKGAPNRNNQEGYTGYFSPYGNPRLSDGPEGEYLTERLAEEAVNFIRSHEDKPFFLNMWFYNVHTPLQARQEKIDKYQQLADPDAAQRNAVYAAMVEHTDEAVGRIIDQLYESGLLDNTIIIFTSDNGGLLGNPNNPITSNHPLRAGKGHAYEGGVRVPLIIAGPGIAAGNISSEPVISEDFFPTINTLAKLGVNEVISSSWSGSDLSSLLNHNRKIDRKSIFWHYPHYHRQGATPYSAIRMGDYKLIHFYEDGRDELYNLAADIGESNDLSTTEPGVMDLLKPELERLLLNANAQLPSLNPNYDPSR